MSHRLSLFPLVLAALHAALLGPEQPSKPARTPQAESSQLLGDPGFEAIPTGVMRGTEAKALWEVQRTGRKEIRERLLVASIEGQEKARSGNKCLSLSLPHDTVGFEFVTVGQRVKLAAGRQHQASIWVRWTDGPLDPPGGANATSGHPSAIVSFWARHRDGKGTFAGQDVWLFDSRWHRLAFRFYPTDSKQHTLVYVSLLPNQRPRDTTVLIDDFELTAHEVPAEPETRLTNLVADPGFDGQQTESVVPPWHFVHRGGTSIAAKANGPARDRCVTIDMPQGRSNFESAQLWQHIGLRSGARYEVSCRIRWNNFSPDTPPPIVNYGIYHAGSNTWYGPVDQVLQENAGWNTYRFEHIPPYSGSWKLYVQLNGWGNFGRAVSISLDDLSCSRTAGSGQWSAHDEAASLPPPDAGGQEARIDVSASGTDGKPLGFLVPMKRR